jgi:hypothetical protein
VRRPNWEHASYGAVDVAELDEKDLRWLCGCGQAKPYADSKAYPICTCGLRMRILDHARLGYVTVATPFPPETQGPPGT